jgi:hypothetical protein
MHTYITRSTWLTGVRKVRLDKAVRLPLEDASQKKMP